jgi:SAM-dependent methyltransferase
MSVIEAVSSKELAFNRMVDFWINKIEQQGDGYVGRLGESQDIQKQRIQDIVKMRIDPSLFYDTALDFGSGWGRFDKFLSDFCGHVWAVDILDTLVRRAAQQAPCITPYCLGFPIHIPLERPKFDLFWGCLVFQHIVNDKLLEDVLAEIRRVLKSGCRVMIVDNAKDRAIHVKPRDPKYFADGLQLKHGWRSDLVTINNRPQDHWFIDGVVA